MCTAGKDSSPAASLHIRPKEPKKFVTPSPGAYNPENADKEVKTSSAKFSFGIKTDVKNVSDSPGGCMVEGAESHPCIVQDGLKQFYVNLYTF
jgi:hypothetical protein